MMSVYDERFLRLSFAGVGGGVESLLRVTTIKQWFEPDHAPRREHCATGELVDAAAPPQPLEAVVRADLLACAARRGLVDTHLVGRGALDAQCERRRAAVDEPVTRQRAELWRGRRVIIVARGRVCSMSDHSSGEATRDRGVLCVLGDSFDRRAKQSVDMHDVFCTWHFPARNKSTLLLRQRPLCR